MANDPFRARLEQGPILLDGAMGTELYRRGYFINNPFEGINLTNAKLVETIHREYVEAGAEAIGTNTFASNRIKLRRVGLEEKHDEINRRAVEIARSAAGDRAFVVGSIGPSGTKWPSLNDEERAEAIAANVDLAQVLLDAGVDALCLETYELAHEMTAMLDAIRPLTDKVIFAYAAFTGAQATSDGVRPGMFAQMAIEHGADVVGANCADGPHELYEMIPHMLGRGKPVAVVPNAGYPKSVDGRMIYMATPEYFSTYSMRFLDLGVLAIGGCCGTTPDHIRNMAGAVKRGGGRVAERKPPAQARRVTADYTPEEPMPFSKRSRLAAKIASDEGFVVSVEVNPPTGLDPTQSIEGARMLQAAGVDVVNIADGPRASVRMSNWSLGLRIQQELDMECIIHLCMRDRNLLGLQSDVLAYYAMGLHNLVVITGDPPKLGDYPHATAVFDLDSVGAIEMIENFNRGIDPAGRPAKGKTQFAIACGVEPEALDYEREIRRLEDKVANGANFIMTQPVYDPRALERILDDTEHLNVPVLVGLLPLASSRNAEFLHNEVPGMQIPSEIRERMAKVGKGPAARQEGVRIAQEALLAVKDRIRGAYIMPPFGRYEAAVEILECIGYERPAGWEDTWRE